MMSEIIMRKIFVVFLLIILIGLAFITYRSKLGIGVHSPEISQQQEDLSDPIPANVTIRTIDAKTPAGVSIRSTPTIQSQSPDVVASATQISLQPENERSLAVEGNLDVAIFDLLDEPIPTGSIIIDGATYSFSDGRFQQKNTTTGVHTLAVQADSYQSSSKQITYPNEKTVAFQLDYVFSPEIHVVDPARSNAPVADATVYLWMGNKAPRPIESRTRVPLESVIMPSDVAREGNQIRIVNQTRGMSFPIHLKMFSCVLKGDTIVSYGRTVWDERKTPSKEYQKGKNNSFIPLSDFRSRKVKLWDSMGLFGMGKKTSGLTENPMSEFIEMDRDGVRFFTFLRIQYDELTSEPQVMGYTDGNGNFTFTDLLPGIYYVQVQKEGALSDRLPIAPCYQGANVLLSNQSTVSIRVYCKDANYEANEMNSVKNASVSLKRIDAAGLFTAMTDKRGKAVFSELPIGNYRATISPPPRTFNPHPFSKTFASAKKRRFIISISIIGMLGKFLESY